MAKVAAQTSVRVGQRKRAASATPPSVVKPSATKRRIVALGSTDQNQDAAVSNRSTTSSGDRRNPSTVRGRAVATRNRVAA